MRFDEIFGSAGGKYAAQAYWNALTKLRAAWKEVYGEDLPTVGNRAMDAYEQAIDIIKARLVGDAAGDKKLRDILDVDATDDIAEVLLGWADMDDVPPKVVKLAMREECARLGLGRHELRDLLRPVLVKAFAGAKTRRPRAGPNRHWPRLLQYLRELEEETDWRPAGRGVRLMNSGGGGPVAREPGDPGVLAIRIDPDYL